MRNIVFTWSRLAALALLLLPAGVPTAAASAKMPVIAKWGRFEQAFKSSVLYSNAVQDASLTVVFHLAAGRDQRGGRVLGRRQDLARALLARPAGTLDVQDDLLGHGQRRAAQTRPANSSAPPPPAQPVSISTARCASRATAGISNTPTARRSSGWRTPSGPARARRSPRTGISTRETRAYQRFTVAQWAVAPGDDVKKQSAYTGFPERIAINPDFFKRLDAKLDTLSQAGILSAIAPLLELQSQKERGVALPDDQAELLVRYVVARWGAEPVAWLLAFESDSVGQERRALEANRAERVRLPGARAGGSVPG